MNLLNSFIKFYFLFFLEKNCGQIVIEIQIQTFKWTSTRFSISDHFLIIPLKWFKCNPRYQ